MQMSSTAKMPASVTTHSNFIAAITLKSCLFKKDVDFHSRSRPFDKLAKELRKLMEICCQNLLPVQELQKRAHHKEVKSHSYTLDEKVWLNSKYIKTKKVAVQAERHDCRANHAGQGNHEEQECFETRT